MTELLKPEEEAEREEPLDTNATAIAVALDHARSKRPPTSVDRFLARQEELIADQRHHLAAQYRTLAIERWSKRVKLTTQGLTLLVGVLLLGVVLWMAWEAHDADGLVIKPFSVPPALTARGVTGEAVASKVMDKLSAMAEITHPTERQKSLATDGGEHVSIAIPETGVSLGQIEQWLRDKLGHERRVTGDVSLDSDGKLTLDARVGAHPLPPQTGAEADLDTMVQKVAEAIYREEQPISWYQYLAAVGRWPEALAASQRRYMNARTPQLKAITLNGTGVAIQQIQGYAAAIPYFERSVAADPLGYWAAGNLAVLDAMLGQDQRAYEIGRESLRRVRASGDQTPEARRASELGAEAGVAWLAGDPQESLRAAVALSETTALGSAAGADTYIPQAKIALHQYRGALSGLQPADSPVSPRAFYNDVETALSASGLEAWTGVLTALDGAAEAAKATPGLARTNPTLRLDAMRTTALAKLGRLDEARQAAAGLPNDCVFCLWAKADLAAAAGDRAAEDRLYAEAVRLTPSLPQSNERWGRVLLARGDNKGALARFDAAAAQGPHFADAIEGRGEVLLAQGDAGGAARAFQAAAKFAPAWGRLHLKWAEALARLGQRDQARAELRLAGQLDLTQAERTELAGQRV